MSRNQAELTGNQGTAPVPSFPWLDESWRIVMGKPTGDEPCTPKEKAEVNDLCCICAYAKECMYRGTTERPKLFCELFDVDVNAIAEGVQPTERTNDTADPVAGLCCNCENRPTCTIRMTKGNVWHCEEYR